MTDDRELPPIARLRVLHPISRAAAVRRDIVYRQSDAGPLTLDVYSPESAAGSPTPAVVLVTGYRDEGARQRLGCRFKDMGSYVSWAELIASAGVTAVTYVNADPLNDAHAVLEYVRGHAQTLTIDRDRLGLWACSGNVPNALALIAGEAPPGVRCAALCYGYMLDADGTTGVADAARQWGFVNPGAGRTVADLSRDVPLFVARAGRDETPGLNDSIDRFAAACLARNHPFALLNHPEGPHAFDLLHDSEATRRAIDQIIAFLRLNLLASS
jgi:dienelactone hydrolase